MAVRSTFRFTMGEVFPADDPVARWLVTMSVGLNDVVLANTLMEKAGKDYQRLYFFRLASMHLWELSKFITESHDAWAEIRSFVAGLPEDARKHYEAIRGIATTGDLSTVGRELVQVRDLFSHYQEMSAQGRANPRDPITSAINKLAGEAIELEIGEEVRDLRLAYGDEVIAKTVMRLLPDEETQRRVLKTLGEAVGHVAQFVQIAFGAWLEPRMEKLERVR